MKLISLALIFNFLFCGISYAQTSGGGPTQHSPTLSVTDGSTTCYPYQISVGSVTSCTNGVATIATGGGGVGVGTVNVASQFKVAFYGATGTTLSGANNFYNNGNNVGIGSVNPIQALDVVGTVRAQELDFSTTAGIISGLNGSAGAVTITGGTSSTVSGALNLITKPGGGGDAGAINITGGGNGGGKGAPINIMGGQAGAGGNIIGGPVFVDGGSNGGGSVANQNVLLQTINPGNVGISSAVPTQKLDVAGTVKMTGFNMPTGASSGYVLTTNSVGIGTWAPSTGSGGSGTVTSVAATVPSVLSISGSPITGSGTLAIGYSGTALPVANGGTASTTARGAGANIGIWQGSVVGGNNAYSDALAVNPVFEGQSLLTSYGNLEPFFWQSATKNRYDITVSGITTLPTAGANYSGICSGAVVAGVGVFTGTAPSITGTLRIVQNCDPSASTVTGGTLTKNSGTGDSSITFSGWNKSIANWGNPMGRIPAVTEVGAGPEDTGVFRLENGLNVPTMTYNFNAGLGGDHTTGDAGLHVQDSSFNSHQSGTAIYLNVKDITGAVVDTVGNQWTSMPPYAIASLLPSSAYHVFNANSAYMKYVVMGCSPAGGGLGPDSGNYCNEFWDLKGAKTYFPKWSQYQYEPGDTIAVFVVSGITGTPSGSDIYTNSGKRCTVDTTSITAGSGTITATCNGAPASSGTLTTDTIFGNSGTGDATISYSSFTTPRGFVSGLTIDHLTGNVGIGTVTAGMALDVIGTARATRFVGDGSGLTGISGSVANPTGTVGLTAVNGVATSSIRSDGAPALSQSISPTWTGTHTFSNVIQPNGGINSPGQSFYVINTNGTLAQPNGDPINDTSNNLIIDGGAGLFDSNGTKGSNGQVLVTSGSTATWSSQIGNAVNIGVGSPTPGQKLDVIGTVRATRFVGDGSGLTGIGGSISGLTTNKLSKATSSTTIGDSQILDNGTNVGIGTVVPSGVLDVNGTILSQTTTGGSAFYEKNYQNSTNPSVGDLLGTFGFASSNTSSAIFGTGDTITGVVDNTSGTRINSALLFNTSDGTNLVERMRITSTNGNVGIGTTRVTEPLDLFNNTGVNQMMLVKSLAAVQPYILIEPSDSSQGLFGTRTGGLMFLQSGGNLTRIEKNGGSLGALAAGNIGINTTVPVNSIASDGNFSFGSSGYRDFAAPSQGGIIQGNVGIGTYVPSARLEIMGGNVGIGVNNANQTLAVANSTSTAYASTSSSVAVPASGIQMTFENLSTTLSNSALAVVQSLGGGSLNNIWYYGLANSDASLGGSFVFGARTGSTAYNERVRFTPNGNVGIGTTVPGYGIDVVTPNSNGMHSQTTTASGQAGLFVENDRGALASYGGIFTGGSTEVGNLLGNARADKAFIGSGGGSSGGLLLGTLSSAPIVIGVNNAENMRLTTGGNFGIGTSLPSEIFAINGSIAYQKNAPTISSCGTAPTGSVVGNDAQGTITVGGTATACTLTFLGTHKGTHCNITNQSMSITNAMTYTESATNFIVSQAVGLSGDLLDYHCTFDN